jgi:hypothetical protein
MTRSQNRRTTGAKPLPEEPAQHVNRNLLLIAGLFGIAVTWWASRSGPGDAGVERETLTAPEAASDSSWPERAARPAKVETRSGWVADADSQESAQQFRQYVDDKYGVLFRDIDPAGRGALRAALLEREQLVVQINTAKQADDAAAKEQLPALLARKDEMDREIARLLPPGELGRFDALKDSDIERFQVEDYAGGISNVAPLNEAEKQAVLATKLAYREQFRRVLADSRLMSGELTAAERKLAYADVNRALRQSHDGYLQEVRQYLYDDEQFTLLSNYETTEYNAELAKLRGIAGVE